MEQAQTFLPPRRTGILYHSTAILLLLSLAIWLLDRATRLELGPLFLALLLGSVILILPLPLIAYRLYTLIRGAYVVGRDGVRLRWGLRAEDIPADELLWLRPADDLSVPLTLPRLHATGLLSGTQSHQDLREVEFMASQGEDLLLLATPDKVFAISPDDPQAFLRAYHQATELGSLAPLQARSVSPSFLLGEVWESRSARWLLLSGAVIGLVMLVWVAIAVSAHPTLPLGFSPEGTPLEPISSVQLYLLPVINLLFLSANFLLALYFYRRDRHHPFAYLLWGSSPFTGLLLLIAVFFILGNA